MTTETAPAASAGRSCPPPTQMLPARPYHKWGSTEIAMYANLRSGEMYLGDKPRYGVKTALLISAIIVGSVLAYDPAGAFDGTTCQTTEGRC